MPSFESVPFTGDTALVFGKLRSDLAQQGSPIRPLDLQIASNAALNVPFPTEPNTYQATEYAVFNQTVLDTFCPSRWAPGSGCHAEYDLRHLSAVDCSMRSFFKLKVWRVQFGKFARS